MIIASMRWRLLLSMIVIIVLCVVCMSLYLHGTRDVLRRGLMHIQAQEIAAAYIASGDIHSLPQEYAGGEVAYTLYSPAGDVLWISANRNNRPLRKRTDTIDDLARQFWYRMDIGRFINVPVRLNDGHLLMVSRRDHHERATIEALLDARLKHSLILLIPLVLMLCGLIWLLMVWTFSPVRKTVSKVEAIHPGKTHPIPEASLPIEIRPLIRALNQAVARLGEAIDTERQILANGAHELRTPLTIVDLRLQQFQQEGVIDWPILRKDIHRLRRVTEQLLLLAHQDHAALSASASQCHLARVVRETIADIYPLFESKDREIHTDLPNSSPNIIGSAAQVREAVINVIENSLAHGIGQVSVRLIKNNNSQYVTLEVEDQGNGIQLENQSEFFKRFKKGTQESAGSGLGLAIVHRIMKNINGSIRFTSQSPCIVCLDFSVVSQQE